MEEMSCSRCGTKMIQLKNWRIPRIDAQLLDIVPHMCPDCGKLELFAEMPDLLAGLEKRR